MNGHLLPVCARDTGIYLGIFSSLIFLFMIKKMQYSMIPSIKISLILLLFLFPLIIDGFSSYAGIYTTTNEIRIITGLLFGVSLPFFIIPLFSFSPIREKPIPVITSIFEVFTPLLLASILAVLTYFSIVSYIIIQGLIIGTLLIWLSLLFYLYFKRIKKKNLSVIFSICSSVLLLTIFSYIHSVISL